MIRFARFACSWMFVAGVVACGSTENSPGSSSSGGTSGSPGSSSGTDGSNGSDASSQEQAPPASTAEGDITYDKACTEFTACGGTPSGTYDYTSGCLGDLFSILRAQCPTADASGAKVTVAGS